MRVAGPERVSICHCGVMHDSPVDTHSWMIGLDSWVIQDGNYPDFETGQRTDFALEFASRGGLKRLDGAHEVSVRRIEGRVIRQKVFQRPALSSAAAS